MNVAPIPARGESKSINKKTKLINRIIVSTDDLKIKNNCINLELKYDWTTW